MRGPRGQQLLLAINQIRRVERGQLKSMPMRDRIRGARLYAVSAENAAVVVNVVNLSVPLGAADAVLGSILCRLNVNAIRRAIRRTEETRDTLFQAILVALEDVHAAIPFLEPRSPERPRAVRIVLHNRGLEHLLEGDGHSLGYGGYVFED